MTSRFSAKLRRQALEAPDSDYLSTLKLSGPKFEDFEIERDPDTGRDVDLPDIV